MKHYYIRVAGGDNIPTLKEAAESLLKFGGYRVFEETETICIIVKG
jgi:hypothetical protein